MGDSPSTGDKQQSASQVREEGGPFATSQRLQRRLKSGCGSTATEFAFAFSLNCDVTCSVFPNQRAELEDYLSLVLNMALRFEGQGFTAITTIPPCLQSFSSRRYHLSPAATITCYSKPCIRQCPNAKGGR